MKDFGIFVKSNERKYTTKGFVSCTWVGTVQAHFEEEALSKFVFENDLDQNKLKAVKL